LKKMNQRYLGTREFAELLGVSRIAVIKWIKKGKIVAYNVHGRWRIPYSEVEKILRGVQRIRRLAIYARVSSNAQKDDLERAAKLDDFVKRVKAEAEGLQITAFVHSKT